MNRRRSGESAYARAEHREIAGRYARKRRERHGKSPPPEIRLAELRWLFAHRLGYPADDPRVQERIDQLGSRLQWSADKIGNAIELTLSEKFLGSIRTIRCFDVSKAEVEALYGYLRQERQNRRRRASRAREIARRGPKLNPRAAAIAAMLSAEWMPISVLVEQASGDLAFVNENGCVLERGSLERAVRRAVKHLVEGAKIAEGEEFRRPDGTKARNVRLRDPERISPVVRLPNCPQLAPDIGQANSPTTEMTKPRTGKSPDETGALSADVQMAASRGEPSRATDSGQRTTKQPHISINTAATDLSAASGAIVGDRHDAQAGAQRRPPFPVPDDDLGIPAFLRRTEKVKP